jgi:hypothetical protein
MFEVMCSPFRRNWMPRGLCILPYDGLQAKPSSNGILRSEIKREFFASDHSRQGFLGPNFDITHPPMVAFLADARRYDVNRLCTPPDLANASIVVASMLTVGSYAPWVLCHYLVCPVRHDMFARCRGGSAEDASALGHWYNNPDASKGLSHPRDAEGRGYPRPYARGRSARPQEGSEGKALNSPPPEEVASQTAPASTGADCTAKRTRSGNPEHA